MNKDNYLIIWHDRHRDDEYTLVLNANYREAEEAELEIAKKAGWENEKGASESGFGDYGYGEDYYINMIELKPDQIIRK